MDMAGRKLPTVRLRRLAGELRRLREAAGLSRETVTAKTGLDESSIYRVETAQTRPQRRTVMALLNTYGITDQTKIDEMVELAKTAGQPGWVQTYEDYLSEQYTVYIGFEGEASKLSNYETVFVPGLLQTQDYARAVIRGVVPAITDDQVDRHVEARMRRQDVFKRTDPMQLWAVIDEAAIRRQVGGPNVMHAQLQHLAEAAKAPHITIQAIPYEAGAHPGMPGSFVVMEFPDPSDAALVYTDSMAGDLFLEKESDVARYRATFQQLVAQALSPAATKRVLRDAAQSA
jgi:transcriptional regulator with XRE-family HTH domain